jgi:hypothetical protein
MKEWTFRKIEPSISQQHYKEQFKTVQNTLKQKSKKPNEMDKQIYFYSSPLKRCMETCACIMKIFKILGYTKMDDTIYILPNAYEVNPGKCKQGLNSWWSAIENRSRCAPKIEKDPTKLTQQQKIQVQQCKKIKCIGDQSSEAIQNSIDWSKFIAQRTQTKSGPRLPMTAFLELPIKTQLNIQQLTRSSQGQGQGQGRQSRSVRSVRSVSEQGQQYWIK